MPYGSPAQLGQAAYEVDVYYQALEAAPIICRLTLSDSVSENDRDEAFQALVDLFDDSADFTITGTGVKDYQMREEITPTA